MEIWLGHSLAMKNFKTHYPLRKWKLFKGLARFFWIEKFHVFRTALLTSWKVIFKPKILKKRWFSFFNSLNKKTAKALKWLIGRKKKNEDWFTVRHCWTRFFLHFLFKWSFKWFFKKKKNFCYLKKFIEMILTNKKGW